MKRPELLEQTINEQPHCLFCNKDLIASSDFYMAEAAFRQYPDRGIIDTIFSYTICLACYEKEKNAISKESQKSMQQFFDERIQLQSEHFSFDQKYGLQQCAITGKEATTLQAFQIGAICKDGELADGFGAMLFSEDALDELILLLSDQTKDYLNGFKERIPMIPPEFEDLFKDRPILFM